MRQILCDGRWIDVHGRPLAPWPLGRPDVLPEPADDGKGGVELGADAPAGLGTMQPSA
jgi:hypothetical protein